MEEVLHLLCTHRSACRFIRMRRHPNVSVLAYIRKQKSLIIDKQVVSITPCTKIIAKMTTNNNNIDDVNDVL